MSIFEVVHRENNIWRIGRTSHVQPAGWSDTEGLEKAQDIRKHKRYVKFKTLNEVIAKDTKVIPYHKRTDKRLSYLQNKIVFA